MNAIFIFSTPWAFDPDQWIHEIRIAGPPMTPLVPNARLGLKGRDRAFCQRRSLACLRLGH
jgi:hypothetical protein